VLAVTQARAHLLNVGIVRPREEVTAIDINAFLSRPEGAPPSVGKVADPDKIDVARFLNRCRTRPACPACFAAAFVDFLQFSPCFLDVLLLLMLIKGLILVVILWLASDLSLCLNK